MSQLALLTKAMLHERKDIAISIVGGFIAGVAGVGLFAASGYLISQAVFAPPLYTLIVLTSIVKILGLLRAASRYGERLYSHRATFSILSRLRVSFFSKLVPLTPELFNKNRSGDLLARIVGDVESLQHYFLRVVYPPIILVMVFLATILFASAFSLWIAGLFVLGLLIAAYVVPAVVLLGHRKNYRRAREQRAQLSTDMTELLYGFRDLKVYGQLEQREQELHRASDMLADSQKAAGEQLLRGQSLHAFVTFFVTWGVLGLGAYLIANGQLAGVFLAMLVLIAMTVFDEGAAMATLPAYKQDSEHAAERLAETVRAADAQPEQLGGVLSTEQSVSVDFSQVTFHYADEGRPTLQNIELHIPAGSKTAIVGPSGSGKSSIFQLALKLLKPTNGQVRLNGMPTEELDEASIWKAANVVLQHNHFFKGTIRDNLLLEEIQHSDDALTAMLDQVQLPYLSLDDAVYEKGENLSDGEKQRLALARAMLKGGRLWLLDEPTSSLDAVTEQHIFRHLFAQAKHDTLLMIRHRLTGLEEMDQIIVIEQGRIVEAGSYAELMEQKGYFYEMKQIERQVVGDERD